VKGQIPTDKADRDVIQMIYYICLTDIKKVEIPWHLINETQLGGLLALLESGAENIKAEQERRTQEQRRKRIRVIK
jgi:hypothetical protein